MLSAFPPIQFLTFCSGFEAGPLAEQLSSHTPVPIPYRAPIDWARWATYIAGFLGSLSILRYIAPVLRSRWTWAVISILSSLIFTSGYMFTRIRNVPYSGANGNWIASGYQNQFGQEVQVIALVCASTLYLYAKFAHLLM